MKTSTRMMKPALDEYFKVRQNVICERARFNKRTQSPGEPIDTFKHDLYKLSESCDYGNLRADMIRDIIVVGVSVMPYPTHCRRNETCHSIMQLS